MQITARRLGRAELWSGPQCSGGTRLAFLTEIGECVAALQLETAELTVVVPATTPHAALLLEHRVLRVWEDDTRFDEWRIAVTSRQPDNGEIRISCAPVETFLGVRTSPIAQLLGGVRYYNVEIVGLKPSEILDQWILPSLAADGIAWLARGTIDQDVAIDLALDWDTPLALLWKIAGALKLELQFRRNGTTSYFVDLVTKIGAAAPTVDVRLGKNLAEHQLRRTTDEQANRVFPRGANEEGVHATMGRASWKVTAVNAAVITLADPAGGDGPIAFDGQLVNARLRKADGTLTQVLSSSAAAQTVTVASAAGVVADDLVQFRANAGGDDLTWLDSPADQPTAADVVAGRLDYPDVPSTHNVIPNPAVRTWPAGDLPTGWTKIGAPTTSKELTAGLFRTAPHSLKVIAAATEGVQSPAGKVFPSALKPHIAGFAGLWIASGKVKLELVLTTGGGPKVIPFAPAEATSGKLGQWIDDLGVSGDDINALGATAVAVRVTAIGGAATFYVDRVQATETATHRPFFEGSGGTKLWQLANKALRLRGAPLPAFLITMVDLGRVDPLGHPLEALPELGAAVNVTDARVLAATSGSRIAALRINYRLPGETQVTVSNRPEDLTGALAYPARTARLRPPVVDLNRVQVTCTAKVTATSPTQLAVEVTATDPIDAGNLVTLTVIDYTGLGASPTPVTVAGVGTVTQAYTVPRPAFGSGGARVVWRATAIGRAPGEDAIDSPPQDRDTLYTGCLAKIVSSDADEVTVEVTATALVGTPTVELVAVTGSATKATGPNVGVASPSGTQWVFNRGAINAGAGQAQFRAVLAGYQSDDDFVTIEEQGRDTVPLLCRAKVQSTSPTQVVIRVAVSDPFPGVDINIAYVGNGVGTIAPASPQTILGANVTNDIDTTGTKDFTIDRPAFEAGTGRVIITASRAGRTADSDAVDVPAKELATLLCRAKIQTTNAAQVVIRVAASDPNPGGDISIAYVGNGVGTIAPASPQTILQANVTSDIDTTGTKDITVDRPAYLAGTGRLIITATRAGRLASTDSVDIPALEQNATGSLNLETAGADVIINLAGTDQHKSWKYAVSTSAMPSDASVDSGTVENSRVARITKSTVVPNLGDRYYVKARPFTGSSGGGTGGPYVTAEVERQNKSTTKTLRIGGQGATWWYDGSAAAAYAGVTQNGGAVKSTNLNVIFGRCFPHLAKGLTITAIRARVWRDSSSDTCTLRLWKIDDSGAFTQQGSDANAASSGVWETVTVSSLSVDTSGDATFLAEIQFDAVSGANREQIAWWEVDYTSPALDTST